jgi:hypothetical protein
MTQPQPSSRRLSDADIERLIDAAATKAAEQAVARAFGNLALDPMNPDHLREWHADQLWTRSAREGSKRLSMSMKTTILGTLTTALLYAVWRIVTSGTGQP